MNKFRIYAALAILISFVGIALMSTEKTAGVVIMILGLVPGVIFLQKAKREEKHPVSKTSRQERIPRREKKTILQWAISKIKENQGIPETTNHDPRQEKKSILQAVIEHMKEKPATVEEIQQLRLDAEKYRLKADIAKSKAVISGSKGSKFSLGGSYNNQEDKISGLLRGAVKTKDVDFFSSDSKPDIFGKKDDEDKLDKEKEAYRKRTLGF